MQKVDPVLDYSTITTELVSVTSRHCPGNRKQTKQAESRKRQPRPCDTWRNFAGLCICWSGQIKKTSIHSLCLLWGLLNGRRTKLTHRSSADHFLIQAYVVKFYQREEQPQSLVLQKHGGCLLESSNICFGLFFSSFFSFFFVGLFCWFFLILFFSQKHQAVHKSQYVWKWDPAFSTNHRVAWGGCVQAHFRTPKHCNVKGEALSVSPLSQESGALCSSSLTLGLVHLISNNTGKSPSLLLLAWPVLLLLTTLSSLGVTPPSWPSWLLSVFPLMLLSPVDIFFLRHYACEIWSVIFMLTHAVHAFLQPCAPLSDDLLIQHRLSILGMTSTAASYGRCLLRLEPEHVWDHCAIGGTTWWGNGGIQESRSGP